MKNLLLIFTAVALFSCGSNEEPIIPADPPMPENPKEYIVSLGFSGEITNIEETPLSRATSNDLYGIQVYSMPATSMEESNYKPYAYGLFDDKTKMIVKLLEGYKYKFASTMVLDGKNKLYSDNTGYGYPFYTGNSILLESIFVYSSSKDMTQSVSHGHSGMIIDGQFIIPERPNLDRYYGELSGYIPSENKKASISMKRVVFGIKIISDGLTEGKLKVTLEKSPDLSIIHPSTEIKEIFTFLNSYSDSNAWTADEYSEIIPVSVSWEKADGANVPLVTQDVAFKRNKLTTITVKVKDNSINNGVDISKEDTPMGDGGNITIKTNSGGDTGVTPNL